MSGTTEHGAAHCYYSRISNTEMWPTLECLCGHIERGSDWENAGFNFDQHLDEADDARPTPEEK